MSRTLYCTLLAVMVSSMAAVLVLWPWTTFYVLVSGTCIAALGLYDVIQRRDPVLRNTPIFGRFYVWFRALKDWMTEIAGGQARSYSVFSATAQRLIQVRAQGHTGILAFGSQIDWARVGHMSVLHSLAPVPESSIPDRVEVGSSACRQRYSASLLNISALSAGALSRRAILALSRGARQGGLYYNTGEGGPHPAFFDGGGDLVWQIGTAYFGCRTAEG